MRSEVERIREAGTECYLRTGPFPDDFGKPSILQRFGHWIDVYGDDIRLIEKEFQTMNRKGNRKLDAGVCV